MTTFTAIERVGPVTITKVEAEILETPTKYILDCDYAYLCEWGAVGITEPSKAHLMAIEHSKVHPGHSQN